MALIFGAVLFANSAFGSFTTKPNCNSENYSCTEANKSMCTCGFSPLGTGDGPHTITVQYCAQTFDTNGNIAKYWRCTSGAYDCDDGYYGVKKSTGGMMTQGGPPTELAECKPCPGKNGEAIDVGDGKLRVVPVSSVHSKTTSYGCGYAGISDCYLDVSGATDEYGIWESVGECAYVPD